MGSGGLEGFSQPELTLGVTQEQCARQLELGVDV
jgi:hypothetical protein